MHICLMLCPPACMPACALVLPPALGPHTHCPAGCLMPVHLYACPEVHLFDTCLPVCPLICYSANSSTRPPSSTSAIQNATLMLVHLKSVCPHPPARLLPTLDHSLYACRTYPLIHALAHPDTITCPPFRLLAKFPSILMLAICKWLVKDFCTDLVPFLTTLFNKSISC